MFLGHYGVAFAAKRVAPRTSLGALAFAAQFLDELWPILLLVGVEQVRVVPGLMAANALDFTSYPWSHSLATAALWGAIIGGTYALLRRDRRGGWVMGLLVLSHWILDVPMHRPDLPLWPGSRTLVGLGVWRSVPATIAVEVLLFAAGIMVYTRATHARDGIGRWGFWALVAVLAAIFFSGATGAPPPSARAVAVTTVGLWLFVPWAWWVDRHRELVRGAARHDDAPEAANPVVVAATQ